MNCTKPNLVLYRQLQLSLNKCVGEEESLVSIVSCTDWISSWMKHSWKVDLLVAGSMLCCNYQDLNLPGETSSTG